MLITFEVGTVAEISAGDTTLGGVRNFLEVYSSRARLHCNMSLNDSLLWRSDQKAAGNQGI